MLNTPVPTHFAPLVPLAWALRAQGHDVVAAVQPDVVGTARSAGLNTVSLGDPYHVDDLLGTGLPPGKRLREVRPLPEPGAMAGGAKVWMMHARYLLPDHLDFARRYRPDLIVADMLEYSSLMVGAVLGVPVVHHRWGLDPISTAARPSARRTLAPLCRRLGLAGLPDPAVVLDPSPPELALPGTAAGTPIRYVAHNGAGELPHRLHEEKPAGLRRVVVTLGTATLELGGVPLLRHVLRGFAGMADTEALATVPVKYRDELGELPPQVRVIDPVPLAPLLERCDAVVHHGGAGTMMTATAAGLPQLVLPQLMDQLPHGEALFAAGAALCVPDAAEQDDPARVGAAVADLLDTASYRERAAELAASIASMPSPAEVAAELVGLVGADFSA